MKGSTRIKLEMGARALEFSRAHPNASPGYVAAVAELGEQLARSRQLAAQQQQGIVESRAATARKRELVKTIRQSLLVHVARAARRAAREVPELTQKFAMPRDPLPYLTFRTLARSMADEAQQRKELLVRYGLVEQVLLSLVESLDEFDQAIARAAEGRRLHIAAGVELDVVADEVVDIVQVIDGSNRFFFGSDPDLFAAWRSARNVIGPSRTTKPSDPEAPPSEGAVKPAA